MGFQKTPVDSIATWVTPRAVSQELEGQHIGRHRTKGLMVLVALSMLIRDDGTGHHTFLVQVQPRTAFVDEVHVAPPA